MIFLKSICSEGVKYLASFKDNRSRLLEFVRAEVIDIFNIFATQKEGLIFRQTRTHSLLQRDQTSKEQQQPWWSAHWMGLQPEPCCPSIPPACTSSASACSQSCLGMSCSVGAAAGPCSTHLGTCKGQHRSTKHQGLCSTSTCEWSRTCIGALGATELLLHSASSLPPFPLAPTATSTIIHIFIGVNDGTFCPKSHLSPCPKFSQHPEPAPSHRLMWHPRPVVLMGFAHRALHAVLCNHRSSHGAAQVSAGFRRAQVTGNN